MSVNTEQLEFNQTMDETSTIIPDTLVLRLVEYDVDTRMADTMLYLMYDNKNETYIIRGLRNATRTVTRPLEYSFQCDDVNHLANFIQFVVCKENKVSYIMYNYTNLPDSSNDITYHFLEENRNVYYEIAGYDDCKVERPQLVNILQMLRTVYNYY